jgi:nucleotide-binding universal stress UspA family protein
LAVRQADGLFADTLCLVSGKDEQTDWQALEQALKVIRREGGRLHGLHIVPSARNKKRTQATQAEFERRCQAAGLPAELVIEVGGVVRRICERARWADLVVLGLAHPPAAQPLARLGSNFSALIRRCPRPVLVVPGDPSPLNRALLAYDGSPKADEALFVAARLCQLGHWNIPLTVVMVTEDDRIIGEILARAQKHLEAHKVQATFIQESGPVAEAILKVAAAHVSDLIIMGSYGFSPMLAIALGSSVDEVLRTSRQPVLVCR